MYWISQAHCWSRTPFTQALHSSVLLVPASMKEPEIFIDFTSIMRPFLNEVCWRTDLHYDLQFLTYIRIQSSCLVPDSSISSWHLCSRSQHILKNYFCNLSNKQFFWEQYAFSLKSSDEFAYHGTENFQSCIYFRILRVFHFGVPLGGWFVLSCWFVFLLLFLTCTIMFTFWLH